MARTDIFTGLSEFLAVAETGSFRAAAASLRVTPAAVSQAVKALEARTGTPLFLRTTRSLAVTEAGAALLSRLKPATAEIEGAFDNLNALRGEPAGLLKLSVPRIALELVVLPSLPLFRRAHPAIKVEIDVNDASVDLMEAGFDAGIRIGNFIEKDMIAVRLTRDFQWCVVGSPRQRNGRIARRKSNQCRKGSRQKPQTGAKTLRAMCGKRWWRMQRQIDRVRIRNVRESLGRNVLRDRRFRHSFTLIERLVRLAQLAAEHRNRFAETAAFKLRVWLVGYCGFVWRRRRPRV